MTTTSSGIYRMPAGKDISIELIKIAPNNITPRKEKYKEGFYFPLLYNFLLINLKHATETFENFNLEQMLQSDNVDTHPNNLSVLMQKLIESQFDKNLLGFKPVTNGFDMYFGLAKKYRILKPFDLSQILQKFAFQLSRGCNNFTETYEMFEIVEYYLGDIKIKDLGGLAAITCLKQNQRGFILKMINFTNWESLSGSSFGNTVDEIQAESRSCSTIFGMNNEIKATNTTNQMDLGIASEEVQFARSRMKVRCYNCGKLGHYSRDCKRKNNRKKENTYLVEIPEGTKLYESHDGTITSEIYVEEGKSDEDDDEENNYVEECYYAGESQSFIMDSGSTIHITNDDTSLLKPKPSDTQVKGVSGMTKIKAEGDLDLGKLLIEDVKYLPEAPRNLLSVHLLSQKGYQVLLAPDGGKIIKNDEVIGNLKKVNKFWEIDQSENFDPNSIAKLVFSVTTTKDEIMACHEINGHASFSQVKVLTNGKYKDADIKEALSECLTCAAMVKKPSGKLTHNHYQVGELIQADVIGPINGIYALLISDRASTFTMVRILKFKSEVSEKTIEILGHFDNMLKLQHKNICCFRADNEFNTKSITTWLKGNSSVGRNSIQPEFTAPKSSYQNGGAERINGLFEKRLRLLITSSNLDISYWNFAINHVVFLHNHLVRTSTGKSPFEQFKNVVKKVKPEAPFGCLVYYKNIYQNAKLQEASSEGIFLGYNKTTKIAFVLTEGRIIRTSAFKCVPTIFPMKNSKSKDTESGENIMTFGGGGGSLRQDDHDHDHTITGQDSEVDKMETDEYKPSTSDDQSIKEASDNFYESESTNYPPSDSTDIEVEFGPNRPTNYESDEMDIEPDQRYETEVQRTNVHSSQLAPAEPMEIDTEVANINNQNTELSYSSPMEIEIERVNNQAKELSHTDPMDIDTDIQVEKITSKPKPMLIDVSESSDNGPYVEEVSSDNGPHAEEVISNSGPYVEEVSSDSDTEQKSSSTKALKAPESAQTKAITGTSPKRIEYFTGTEMVPYDKVGIKKVFKRPAPSSDTSESEKEVPNSVVILQSKPLKKRIISDKTVKVNPQAATKYFVKKYNALPQLEYDPALLDQSKTSDDSPMIDTNATSSQKLLTVNLQS